MNDETVRNVDEKFRNKWRSLMSVDDLVEEVANVLMEQVRKKKLKCVNLIIMWKRLTTNFFY